VPVLEAEAVVQQLVLLLPLLLVRVPVVDLLVAQSLLLLVLQEVPPARAARSSSPSVVRGTSPIETSWASRTRISRSLSRARRHHAVAARPARS
jgi:hypothetical protein